MNAAIDLLHRLVRYPGVYSLWRKSLGGRRYRERFVAEHVCPQPGARLLDVGCGTAEVATLLTGLEYTGIDLEPRYLAYARRRFGRFGTFHRLDIKKAKPRLGNFDYIIAMGLLHHLDDTAVARLFEVTCGSLRPGGRMITIDVSLEPSGHSLAQWSTRHDRGEHVREAAGYYALAAPHFRTMTMHVRRDLLKVPLTNAWYTMTVLECSDPALHLRGEEENKCHQTELLP